MRCSGITKGGSRCQLPASHGSYCYLHAPENAAKRHQDAARGGRAGGNGRTSSGTVEVEGIKAMIQTVIDGAADGSVTNGGLQLYGLNTLLRAVEVGRKVQEAEDFDARLTELERDVGVQRKASQGKPWGV